MTQHLGLQKFNKIESKKITNEDLILSNKLNLPFHKDLIKPSFGDLYTESNVVKFINNEIESITLLDLSNDDLLKTLLVSEVLFDDFLNCNESNQTSNSFNNILTLNQDIFQNVINTYTDATIYFDSTINLNIIELQFIDNIISEEINNKLLPYITAELPILFKFINTLDSTAFDQMVVINSIELLNDILKIGIKDFS